MEKKIKEILSEISGIPASEITRDTRITGDLGMTSFDLADTVITVEETYGLRIPDERFSDLETVGDIMRIIEEDKVTWN